MAHGGDVCVNMEKVKAENNLSLNQNQPNKLLSCLYSQRRSGIYCDVILIIGEEKFSVHACVLASFSPYFNDILSSTFRGLDVDPHCQQNIPASDSLKKDILDNWSLRNPLHLALPLQDQVCEGNKFGCSDCTTKVLDFMYLGKIQLESEHVEHVRLLSTVLEVSELLLICDKYSENNKLGKKRKLESSNRQTLKKPKVNISSHSELDCDTISDENKPIEGGIFDKNTVGTKDILKNISETKCDPPTNQTSNLGRPICINTENISVHNVKKNESSPTNIDTETCKSTDSHTCSICELKFSNSVLLRQHRETHLGRLNMCYACKFSSYKAFELIKHLLETEHEEIICSLCLFEAETPEKLKDHLKQHNHSKPFFCTVCNVRFQTRASLNTHTPKHSTEMPFSCSVCNRAFKWKQGLQSHMAVHTPEKKHLCSECGFSTAYQSTFKAHTLVHTSEMFMCPHTECNFKSVRKHNFMSHLMTHSKEKPYQCEICGQSFSQSRNLRRHAVQHDEVAEEFVEHCPLCLYKTMRLDKLKIHFKKHHPEDDIELLNVKRKKHRMPRVPVQRETVTVLNTVNNPNINISEKLKEVSVPGNTLQCSSKSTEAFKVKDRPVEELYLANNAKNKQTEENTVVMNAHQMAQAVVTQAVTNVNATILVTGLKAQLPKLVRRPTTSVQKTSLGNFQVDPLFGKEGAIIVLDTGNLNSFLVPANDRLLPISFSTVNNLKIPDVIDRKQGECMQINTGDSTQITNIPLKATNISTTNVGNQRLINTDNISLHSGKKPKLLVVDDVLGARLNSSSGECILKSSIECNNKNEIQKLMLEDSFTDTLNNTNGSQIQNLTAIVDGINSGEVPQPCISSVLNATVGSLINEQLQVLTSHKDESALDMLNNNMLQELFADEGENTDLVVHDLALNEDSTNTLDMLSKDVQQLVRNEEKLNVVLDSDNEDKVLLCHETIDELNNHTGGSPDEVPVPQLQVNDDCDNQGLSIEFIFESLSLPEKI